MRMEEIERFKHLTHPPHTSYPPPYLLFSPRLQIIDVLLRYGAEVNAYDGEGWVMACVAVRCGVLHCVAVCCSVGQEMLLMAKGESWHCNTLSSIWGRKCIWWRGVSHGTATHCSTLQHTATHCNTLQRTAAHCNSLQRTVTHCCTLQHTTAHCHTLQHINSHCNIPSHTATHRHTLPHTTTHCTPAIHRNTPHHTCCTATHCNTLQHTATHRNTPQHACCRCVS